MLKRWVSCLLAAVIWMGGCVAMGENAGDNTFFYEDAGAAWYQQALTDAQMSLGNNLRIKQVIARARAGENVTVAFIGGSITEGAGAAKYQECYASRTFQGFRDRYGVNGGGNVHCLNAGVGGTPSPFGFMRYQRDIVDRVRDDDGLPDLVVIEFAVNDYMEPTNHQCYESMVKTILSQENRPAVILLFAVFDGGFNLQGEIRRIGDAYDLMMVSIKDGAYAHVGQEWTKEQFYFDQYHPTSLGHAVMADCLLAAIDAAEQAETAPADIDLDVKPAYGTDYMGLITVYADAEHEEIALDRGGFDKDDTASYRNQPVGRVCGENFHYDGTGENAPLRFTAMFKKLLVAWRAVNDDSYGTAEIRVDGRAIRTVTGGKDKWGQSEVVIGYSAGESAEHTVEIAMAEGSENKKFTVTCLSYVP